MELLDINLAALRLSTVRQRQLYTHSRISTRELDGYYISLSLVFSSLVQKNVDKSGIKSSL